jgi:excinuclease ABC subunit C
VANESVGTVDAVGVALSGTDANAQVFQVRDGVLSDRQSFYLMNLGELSAAEVLEEFLLQYYTEAPSVPAQIIVEHDTDPVLAELLTDRRGARVEVRRAERGDKKRILELAVRNARLALDTERLKEERRREQRVESLSGLQAAWGSTRCRSASSASTSRTSWAPTRPRRWWSSRAPRRRSPTTGASSCARRTRACRRLRVDGEVLRRRLENWERQQDLSPHDPKRNESFATLPSLIVIDGGPGPALLGALGLQGFRDRGVAVISLAKRIEEVFLPGRTEPLLLGHDTPELQLLQRVRDEAHRFAITHHRTRRDRAMTESILDGLPASARRASARCSSTSAPRRRRRRLQGGARGGPRRPAEGRARAARAPAHAALAHPHLGPRTNGSTSWVASPDQNRPGSYQLAGRLAGSRPMFW